MTRNRSRLKRIRAALPFALMLVSGISVAATYQARTFDPTMYKFYGGLNPNTYGFTNAVCGIQLPSNADCWGNFVGYVLQTITTLRTLEGDMPASARQPETVVSRDVTYG